MFLSFPIGTTCLSLDSFESNPTKDPAPEDIDFSVQREGERVMLSGTSERKMWPLAAKFDPSRDIKDLLLPSTSPEAQELNLLRLDPIVEQERTAFRERELAIQRVESRVVFNYGNQKQRADEVWLYVEECETEKLNGNCCKRIWFCMIFKGSCRFVCGFDGYLELVFCYDEHKW